MSSDGSITCWLDQLNRGDAAAAQALWERYFPQLVRLARSKLHGVARRAADEEDVALSAMDSFFHAAQLGRFPNLTDRHDLWRLLLQITARKAVDLRRKETRQRRGGGQVRGESALRGQGPDGGETPFAQVVGDTPTPEFAAMVSEECRRLLNLLGDPALKALALAKMEGYTNSEIAQQLDCSVRSVNRRLRLIRRKWKQEPSP